MIWLVDPYFISYVIFIHSELLAGLRSYQSTAAAAAMHCCGALQNRSSALLSTHDPGKLAWALHFWASHVGARGRLRMLRPTPRVTAGPCQGEAGPKSPCPTAQTWQNHHLLQHGSTGSSLVQLGALIPCWRGEARCCFQRLGLKTCCD